METAGLSIIAEAFACVLSFEPSFRNPMHLSSSHLSAEKLNDSLNVIRVCSSPSCEMLGQNLLIAEICRILGIELGESSSDGRFHLISMPCPGYCDKAPMFRVNDVSFEEQDIENIQKILNSYLLSVV